MQLKDYMFMHTCTAATVRSCSPDGRLRYNIIMMIRTTAIRITIATGMTTATIIRQLKDDK